MTMRYLMKGGYWKNSEDEILKAAVMKYGLNQWARIASLLSRKSAKQCKARWYEWLDPGIKKTEWTREEEEKLLHLARIFPAQWRTIAPLLDRTPNMCLEHYEKLLDMAQGRAFDDDNDPRKLLPGEVDPNPENRPARADPIDMDDDEVEMIAETRVRLANDKGKKAKRKARERVLEEARRLATIQKFRELKNAGVDFVVERKPKKKKKEFSYGDEVPMERQPVEAVFSVDREEKTRANYSDPNLGNINISQLEGQRRDEIENRRRQEDREKIKKLKALDLPGRLEKLAGKNPVDIWGRSDLSLPPPQLKDEDIHQLYLLKKRNLSQFFETNRHLGDQKASEKISLKESEEENSKAFCTDLLLPFKTSETLRDLLPQERTPKPVNLVLQQARELSVINDPKASNKDSSTILDNHSVSIAPSSATSKLSTPNPYKQLIQNLNEGRGLGSRFGHQANQQESNASLFEGREKLERSEAQRGNRHSISECFFQFDDHLGLNQRRNESHLENDEMDWRRAIAHNEFGGSQLAPEVRKELSRQIKTICESFPQPKNSYKVDVEDLRGIFSQLNEISENDSEQKKNFVNKIFEKEVDEKNLKLSESFKQKLRFELEKGIETNSHILKDLSFIELLALKKIAKEVNFKDYHLLKQNSFSENFSGFVFSNSFEKHKQEANQLIEIRKTEILKNLDKDGLERIKQTILSESQKNAQNILQSKNRTSDE